jgi:catechol 2,3-dioxygenase-like lactoylglutathione lyase family enzyme
MLGDAKAFSGFAVDDLDAARRFYGETLGVEIDDDGLGLGLRLGGGGTVFVYPKPDHRPAEFTILNFPVADIDAAVDELAARGIEMKRYDGFGQDERGIAKPMGGPRIAWFEDPAGNVLSVLGER